MGLIPVYNHPDRTQATRMAHGKLLHVKRGGCWYYHAEAPTEAFAGKWVRDEVNVPVWNVPKALMDERLGEMAA
jgi:hypothetical protein